MKPVRPAIHLIAAVADNGVIGHSNRLPWHLPEDLQYFKKTTLGHPVLMGRQTFDSIGRPLPGRQNIVLTRRTNWQVAGVTVAPTLDAAWAAVDAASTAIFVIGGAQLYAQTLPLADRLYITEVHLQTEGDTAFPPWPRTSFIETSRTAQPATAERRFGFDFVIYQRQTRIET
ncbi:MAG: dihydrofolate reductase [Burkholderiaceae bacterium]